MKRTVMTLTLSAALLLSTAACSRQQVDSSTQNVSSSVQTAPAVSVSESASVETAENQPAGISAADGRTLIVYFTVPETDGVDTVANASRVATENGVLGNVEFLAHEIQKNIGGELFAIETVQDYPGTHSALLEFAHNEMENNERPELSTHIDNLDDYDTIFIGYPIWNADLPMPLYTFFDEYDFSGKTIIPFVAHGGSGMAGTVRTIQELEPNATVIDAGLSVSRNDVATAQADVKAWTDSLFTD